jgi:hypothetical protein
MADDSRDERETASGNRRDAGTTNRRTYTLAGGSASGAGLEASERASSEQRQVQDADNDGEQGENSAHGERERVNLL